MSALGTYLPPQTIGEVITTGNIELVGNADFDGDGRQDLVVALGIFQSTNTFPLRIFTITPGGLAVDSTATIFAGPSPAVQHPRDIVIDDFNGDHRPDIFVADTGADVAPFPGYPNTLVLSRPDGRLEDASARLPRLPAFTHSADAADIDLDGDLDIYVGNIGTPNPLYMYFLINDGNANFTADESRLPARFRHPDNGKYTATAFADVNGDDRPDLILLGEHFPTPSAILLNTASGDFVEHPSALPSKPFAPNAVGLDAVAVRLNADEHLDLVTIWTKGTPFYQGRWVQFLINNADGTFRDETSTRFPQVDNSGQWMKFLTPVDFDSDGDTDLIARSYWFSIPNLFLENNGAGNFVSLSTSLPQIGGFHVLIDLDLDGGRDFLNVDGRLLRAVRESTLGPPSPPHTVVASDGVFTTHVGVSWKAGWGALEYEAWRSNSDGTGAVLLSTTLGFHFEDASATPGVRYRYWVRPIRNGVIGPPSSYDAGSRYLPMQVEAPTNLRQVSISGDTVLISWVPPSSGLQPTGYQLEGGVTPGSVIGSLPIPGASGNLFTFTAPTGAFYIRLHALAGALKSPPSNEIRIFVNTPAPPDAPSNLLGLANGSSLHLAWHNGTTDGSPTAVILDVTGTVTTSLTIPAAEMFSFPNVPPGTYTLAVRAQNQQGISGSSNAVSLTFPGPQCASPQVPAQFAVGLNGRTIFASWNLPATGAAPTGFVLVVTGAFVGNIPLSGRQISGAVAPGTYSLSVAATNPCGVGPATSVQTVVVQ